MPRPAVKVMTNGREVCANSSAGRLEYKFRKMAMWGRDNGKCCLCGLPIAISEATFEHKNGRGMNGSKRDDRVSMNGVSHYFGNMAKGSMSYEKYMELSAWQRVMNCRGGQ